MKRWTHRRFPTAPLREVLIRKARAHALTMPDRLENRIMSKSFGRPRNALARYCSDKGIERRYLYREALSDWLVDRICVAAGLHPSEVYPDWSTMSERLTEESLDA